jgi:hypothetical protein
MQQDFVRWKTYFQIVFLNPIFKFSNDLFFVGNQNWKMNMFFRPPRNINETIFSIFFGGSKIQIKRISVSVRFQIENCCWINSFQFEFQWFQSWSIFIFRVFYRPVFYCDRNWKTDPFLRVSGYIKWNDFSFIFPFVKNLDQKNISIDKIQIEKLYGSTLISIRNVWLVPRYLFGWKRFGLGRREN